MGPPTLRVNDLEDELSFYQRTLGLQVGSRHTDEERLETVELATERSFEDSPSPLLILKHDPSAIEPPANFAGLFHFAVVVPDRKSLAIAFNALEKAEVTFDGFADHLVSESLYLHDHEGNGIEIYRDRPKDEWPHDEEGRIVMDTLPLDLSSLVAELKGKEKDNAMVFPLGARIGHMHLRVTNLERSLGFYRDTLGFKVTADLRSLGAGFLAAGDYHHHIGMNTWYSAGGTAHAGGEAGLDAFAITVPEASFIEKLSSGTSVQKEKGLKELWLSDPDGIPILIRTSADHKRPSLGA